MNKLVSIILSIAIVVGGIAFAIVGVVQFVNKDKYDSTVKATIVEVTEEWETETDADGEPIDKLVKTAYIDYEVDGKKYEHVLSPVQDNDYKVGDTVDILYQSQNPEKISGQNITTASIAFIGLGLLAAVIGCVMTIKSLKAR